MPEGALTGVRVLDLSLDVAGAYCTRVLADMGAHVLMVEPPEGSPLRRRGPFRAGTEGPDAGGLFLHLSANKSSVAADLTAAEGKRRVTDLAAGADIVVESFPPLRLGSLGLGYEALRMSNPRVVMTSITHFGQTGPYRDWQGEEVVDLALGGYTFLGGNIDREPLMPPFDQAQFNAGSHAALSSLAALWHALDTGQGQQIDLSIVEVMLAGHVWTTTSWTQEGIVMKRVRPDAVRCSDGWVMLLKGMWNPSYLLLIDRPDLLDDPRFAHPDSWMANLPALTEMIAEWCSKHTREEIFRSAQALRIMAAPVNDAEALLRSPEMAAREWPLDVDQPALGPLTMPGFPVKMGQSPLSVRRPAPTLGSHQGSWPGGERPATRSREGRTPISTLNMAEPPLPPAVAMPLESRGHISTLDTAGPPLPLAGVRVLEITNNWAGPLAGRHLGDLGAEVIKIEAPDRPMTRRRHYPGQQPFRYHWDRSAYFNQMNRSKLGIAINLDSNDGRALFLDMVRESDVVLENNSPRVMGNLGIPYDVLRQANPGIIMASISAFGQTGPSRDYVAYGTIIEAACGLMAVTGYPDDEYPYHTQLFYADPVTAGQTAGAIVAALFHRRRTGEGQYIDSSLIENGASFLGGPLIEYAITRNTPRRRGNRDPRWAPQGVYPSFGDDMWVALCVRTDEEWGRFCEVLDDKRLRKQGLATAVGRQAHHDEIDRVISDWSRGYDHHEAARMLQEAGIPSGPVLASWEMVSNPHFHDRGFYLPIVHEETGVFPYPGMPWKLSRTPGVVRRAAPRFGEHTRLVFRDWLGLPEQRLKALYAGRIIADHPPDDLPGPIRPMA